MAKKTTHIYFSKLNLLRFLAAFAIVIYHSTIHTQNYIPESLKMFLHNLPLGVDLFFIISGFLIVYLLLVEKSKTESISLYKFYVRRILRIFPLYFLILGIAYFQHHNFQPPIDFTKYLYFWGNFWMIETNNWTVGILNPLWSICVEEHFYLVIPALILFVPTKRLNYLFWAIIIFSILYRIYLMYAMQWPWMAIYLHTLSRCDLLAFGGLTAFYYQKNQSFIHFKAIYILLAIITLIVAMCFVDSVNYIHVLSTAFIKYLFAIPMLIIFIGVVLNKHEYPFINRLKQNPIIHYPLSIIHYPLFR